MLLEIERIHFWKRSRIQIRLIHKIIKKYKCYFVVLYPFAAFMYFLLYFPTHVHTYRHACRGEIRLLGLLFVLYMSSTYKMVYGTASFKFSWCIRGRVLHDACRSRRMHILAHERAFCVLLCMKRNRRCLYAEARKFLVDLRASVLCQRFLEPYAECVDFTTVLLRSKRSFERNTFLAVGSTLSTRSPRH